MNSIPKYYFVLILSSISILNLQWSPCSFNCALAQSDFKKMDNRFQWTDIVAKINLKSSNFFWCKIFKPFTEKRHIVRIEPILKNFKGLKPSMFSEHLGLFVCKPTDTSYLESLVRNEGLDCSDFDALRRQLVSCTNLYYVMDSPDRIFQAASDTAFPIGTESFRYFMINIHIGLEDESLIGNNVEMGLRVWHTQEFRPNELASMMIGAHPSFYGILLPQKKSRFTIAGHCSAQCFDKIMNDEGIMITHVRPHYQRFGRKYKLRHFRGDRELRPIIDEVHLKYDDLRYYKMEPHIKFMPNDVLTVECTYDTTNANKTIIFEASHEVQEEMCLAVVVGYPITPNKDWYPQTCFSGTSQRAMLKAAGIDKINNYWWSLQPRIAEPTEYMDKKLSIFLKEKTEWRDDIQSVLKDSRHLVRCDFVEKRETSKLRYVGYPGSNKTDDDSDGSDSKKQRNDEKSSDRSSRNEGSRSRSESDSSNDRPTSRSRSRYDSNDNSDRSSRYDSSSSRYDRSRYDSDSRYDDNSRYNSRRTTSTTTTSKPGKRNKNTSEKMTTTERNRRYKEEEKTTESDNSDETTLSPSDWRYKWAYLYKKRNKSND